MAATEKRYPDWVLERGVIIKKFQALRETTLGQQNFVVDI